ncbi:hypothetical protein KSF_005050 [Reticulibacter mediterranei]|uniref:Anaphase-promoting complex subunit 4-like WD40 domain-containing protein n=1 Tax=Reticulibacter mediterranei TaxID=2778369 RepID=A0A8J3MY26_9CHLR|nr:WD40 repeat domain-containing protein [Reticulibacter mediterranei]GHO90457.1 hypothetical protein KSF_005050 [Reticulibacter mediterranei]
MDHKQREKTIIQWRLLLGVFFVALIALGALLAFWINSTSFLEDGPWIFFPGVPLLMRSLYSAVFIGICSVGLCCCFFKIGGRCWEEARRRKQNWLTRYGVQVSATVTDQKEEESLDADAKTSYLLQLTWSDPKTGAPLSFWKKPPHHGDVFAAYPRGTTLSVQYDPADLSFSFVQWLSVPRRRALSILTQTTAGIFVGGSVALLAGDVLWWQEARKRTTHSISYRGHSDPVRTVAWSPDGKLIASGSTDGTVHIWTATDGKRLFLFKGSEESSGRDVTAVAWSPDGTRIAFSLSGLSTSLARSYGLKPSPSIVQVWNASDGRILFVYQGHTDRVNTVAWSPDGMWIASGSDDKTVQVWNASDGRRVSVSPPSSHMVDTSVETLAWSPDSQKIAIGNLDGTIQVLNAADGSLISTYNNASPSTNSDLTEKKSFLSTVAWSPDGTRIASGGDDKMVQIWNATSSDDNPIFTYIGHSGGVETVAWSPDGTRIASGSADKTIQVWNTDGQGNDIVLAYRGHTDTVDAAAWSPNGMWIASSSEDKTVQIWSPTI